MPNVTALTNFAFIDYLGVNVHASWTGTVFSGPASTFLSALQYLGIHHIRDDWGSEQNNSQRQTNYATLLPAGIKVDFVCNGGSVPTLISTCASYLNSYPNSIYAVEGNNETSNGDTSQPTLWNDLQGNSTCVKAGVQVFCLTTADYHNSTSANFGNENAYCNYGNIHWYSNTSDTQFWPFSGWGMQDAVSLITGTSGYTPGKAFVFT